MKGIGFAYLGIMLTACLCLLIQRPVNSTGPAKPCVSQRDEFETTHSRDQRYMTLSHKYDYLWDEWGEDSQLVIADDQTGRPQIPAAISM